LFLNQRGCLYQPKIDKTQQQKVWCKKDVIMHT
jgi:hypothetical protein